MPASKRPLGRPNPPPLESYARSPTAEEIQERQLSDATVSKGVGKGDLRSLLTPSTNSHVHDEPKKLTFFELPGEVQNLIIDFAFPSDEPVTRDIRCRSDSDTSFTAMSSRFDFLATSKRTYAQWRYPFYSQSIFFLASGAIENTLVQARRVPKENLAMITSIGVKFSVNDLEQEDYRNLRDFLSQTEPRAFTVNERMLIILAKTWCTKLEWIMKDSWPAIRRLHLQCPTRTIVVDIEDFRRRVPDPQESFSYGTNRGDTEFKCFFEAALACGDFVLPAKIRELEFRSSEGVR